MKTVLVNSAIVGLVALLFALFSPHDAPDSLRYMDAAVNLHKHGIYSLDGTTPTARDAPGLPFTLFFFLAAGCHDPQIPMRIVNALAVALIALCCGIFIAHLFSGHKRRNQYALVAVYYCGLYPAILGTCLFVLTEAVFTALFLLGNILLVGYFFEENPQQRPVRWLWAGMTWGLAALYRPVILMYPWGVLGLAIVLQVARNGWRKLFSWGTLTPLLALLFGFYALLTPWILRNYWVFQRYIPGCFGAGANLYIGASQEWKGEPPEFDPACRLMETEPEKNYSRLEADLELGRRATAIIRNDPLAWFSLLPWKLERLWWHIPGAKQQIKIPLVLTAIHVIHVTNLFLAAAGVFIWLIRKYSGWGGLAWLLLPVIYTSAVHCVLFALPRFRVPMEPYLCIFAVIALAFAIDLCAEPWQALHTRTKLTL